MPLRHTTPLSATLLAIAWLSAVAFGLRILMKYESTAGSAGAPPAEWPRESAIPIKSARPTLIVLAHPRCPCTKASIHELAQLMTRIQGKVHAWVLFSEPQESLDSLETSSLWKTAAAIPGVTVLADVDGAEARRFQIETSGHTLLFDAEGRLLFSGGITGSRGHEGENAGTSAILSLLLEGAGEESRSLVFGCSLFDPEKQGDDIAVCGQ